MNKIELAPYIFFKGNCTEAMKFYEKVFGGKLDLMKYEDVPGEAKLRKIFEGLSEGVEVAFPLKKEFWGDIFGQVTDNFNVDWMIDITPAK
jgi:uncharacterized glyoxalase superfamily protein PhnB